jgi:hypothetical protein
MGGYVYRGSAICGLDGTYFFADFCSSSIWSLRYVNGQVLALTDRTAEFEPAGTPTIDNISSFGEDAAGELYVCDWLDGEIYRIEAAGNGVDCNANGIPDACDIASGLEPDCNANGIPDTCGTASGFETDCNVNGIPDACDIASGLLPDCNANGIPDTCGTASGFELDCNVNGIPDACDIASGLASDCNGNGIPDTCDIASGLVPDCNGNQVPDACDLASGVSLDVNGSGIPDECDCPGATAPLVYCMAKFNSLFCMPTLTLSGFPSASGASPCVVTASAVLNNARGLLFYGLQSAALPYQGGTLCVQQPLRRTPAHDSGGSATGHDCSGILTFDFGAWIVSGIDPALQAGQSFSCQLWSFDPQDRFHSSLTNAVRASICP